MKLLGRRREELAELLVPQGTSTVTLVGFNCQQVENGAVVNKIFVVNDGARPPFQANKGYVFASLKEALENLLSDVV